MQSVVSYPNRGKYGKSNYRGNCSGYIIKDICEHFQPSYFVDICKGSGTSEDVCRELGIKYTGLDLHTGFDFTRDSVLRHIEKPADVVFSHPPYFSLVDYQAERAKHKLGGRRSGGNDLSRCESFDDFLEQSQLMLMNERAAARPGGIYATLTGDYRKNGQFYSIQSDYIRLMPREELYGVVIKMQHNQMSSFKEYRATSSFIPIMHETLILWKRRDTRTMALYFAHQQRAEAEVQTTWKNIVKIAMMNLGGQAVLPRLYKEIENLADSKLESNPHYKAKVRQTLQMHFENVSRGEWAMRPA